MNSQYLKHEFTLIINNNLYPNHGPKKANQKSNDAIKTLVNYHIKFFEFLETLNKNGKMSHSFNHDEMVNYFDLFTKLIPNTNPEQLSDIMYKTVLKQRISLSEEKLVLPVYKSYFSTLQ